MGGAVVVDIYRFYCLLLEWEVLPHYGEDHVHLIVVPVALYVGYEFHVLTGDGPQPGLGVGNLSSQIEPYHEAGEPVPLHASLRHLRIGEVPASENDGIVFQHREGHFPYVAGEMLPVSVRGHDAGGRPAVLQIVLHGRLESHALAPVVLVGEDRAAQIPGFPEDLRILGPAAVVYYQKVRESFVLQTFQRAYKVAAGLVRGDYDCYVFQIIHRKNSKDTPSSTGGGGIASL